MVKKLEILTEKVTWRIDAEDMALLRRLYPGKTNEVARRIVRQACAGLRVRFGAEG